MIWGVEIALLRSTPLRFKEMFHTLKPLLILFLLLVKSLFPNLIFNISFVMGFPFCHIEQTLATSNNYFILNLYGLPGVVLTNDPQAG